MSEFVLDARGLAAVAIEAGGSPEAVRLVALLSKANARSNKLRYAASRTWGERLGDAYCTAKAALLGDDPVCGGASSAAQIRDAMRTAQHPLDVPAAGWKATGAALDSLEYNSESAKPFTAEERTAFSKLKAMGRATEAAKNRRVVGRPRSPATERGTYRIVDGRVEEVPLEEPRTPQSEPRTRCLHAKRRPMARGIDACVDCGKTFTSPGAPASSRRPPVAASKTLLSAGTPKRQPARPGAWGPAPGPRRYRTAVLEPARVSASTHAIDMLDGYAPGERYKQMRLDLATAGSTGDAAATKRYAKTLASALGHGADPKTVESLVYMATADARAGASVNGAPTRKRPRARGGR